MYITYLDIAYNTIPDMPNETLTLTWIWAFFYQNIIGKLSLKNDLCANYEPALVEFCMHNSSEGCMKIICICFIEMRLWLFSLQYVTFILYKLDVNN